MKITEDGILDILMTKPESRLEQAALIFALLGSLYVYVGTLLLAIYDPIAFFFITGLFVSVTGSIWGLLKILRSLSGRFERVSRDEI